MALAVLMAATTAAACSSSSSSSSSGGAIKTVKGGACAYYVNVGLFGGPQNLRGCGQPGNAPAEATGPTVSLPPGGSPTPITASSATGAKAQYGPAVIFGGEWPDNVDTPPASGPMSVSTQGTPAAKSVTSSADIVQRTPPDPASPGGVGPFPAQADEVHVTCTATDKEVTGSTRFVHAVLATSTDPGGSPLDQQPVPDNPPVNYTRSGVITNVGDVFTAVYNEQVVNADGSLTVNGIHMYLFGPTAVGDMVKGQATCGTTPSKLSKKDSVPPGCSTLVVEPKGPDDPTPLIPRTELVGVFDARGLKGITNAQATNGTVKVGNPEGAAYLRATPGQTGPLAVTATRTPDAEAQNLPLKWSFDATDNAGNVTHCPETK